MKLRHLLFGLLAGVAFVACTNDDDPAGASPVNGGNEVAAAKSYVKVNFVMPGNAATRADETFEAGTEAENQVDSGVLFFFDGTTQVADPYEFTELEWTDETGNIEKKSPIIVVLENPLKNPTSVVAVLNATMTDLDVSGSSSLDDIKAVVKDFSAAEAGKFVMSSSAYDGAENNVAAKIETVYDTYAEAEAAASVTIPVERVVAKVQTTYANATLNLANAEDEASNTVIIDGEEVELEAEVMGWWLDNTASTSLLLKDISANTADDNDADNMRSYFAKPVPGTLKHGTFKAASEDPQYTQENVGDGSTENNGNATQVVVAVTLKDKATGNAVQLVKYLGKLYTQDGFNTEAINVLAHKYFTATTDEQGATTYTTVGADDFNITYVNTQSEAYEDLGVELKDYQAYTLIEKADAEAVFYVKNAAGEYVEADATVLANDMKGYVVQQWNDGMAYYFTAIKHDASRKAVIRNHVYKVNVNSINGLGTPVPFEETDTIIPIIPENTETYISAEIDILAWKVVEQGVDLTAN